MAHWAALISVFVALSHDTSLYCETTDTGLVHRVVCVCLFPSRKWSSFADRGG